MRFTYFMKYFLNRYLLYNVNPPEGIYEEVDDSGQGEISMWREQRPDLPGHPGRDTA